MGLTGSGSPPAAPSFGGLGGWAGVLDRLLAGQSLAAEEAECVLGEIFGGRATPSQTAALLVALRAKGVTVDEMIGLSRGMLAHSAPLSVDAEAVDVVGTGGDRLRSINVSTLAACIVAGAGAAVCKHGGRAASSSVGTADVLEALGVAIELGPAGVARCVAKVGMGFCFAPRFHPAMRFAVPVRRELGIPTVFNFLGPLTNPARTRRQLVGVSDPSMATTMAHTLGANGSVRAMVVHADDGLDELSTTAPTTIVELTGDGQGAVDLRTWRLDPTELGLGGADMADLRGGDAAFNAEAIRRVLRGEPGAHRDIGVLNAAAALVVSGHADDLAAGVALAAAAVEDGRALRVVEELARVSQEAAADEAAAAEPAAAP